MTANDDLDLLWQFSRDHSQEAFTALVNQNLGLVYSAALRQVRSPQLAEEICQTVFTQLSRNAHTLRQGTILSAWLYQVTRNAAIDLLRSETRRKAREQIAIQMSDMNDTSATWSDIELLLDDAMQSLEQTDRAAILLRYFEGKSLKEVGETLGASEDAAQKRVTRAVERLREFFGQHKVKLGGAALAALLSANAIQAAPAGLAALVASGSFVASASTAITLTNALAMTTIQKTIIAALAAGALGVAIFQAQESHNLRKQVQTLSQENEENAALKTRIAQLESERDAAKTAVASQPVAPAKNSNEVLKLRGEVGRLRQENAQIGSSNILSKATATPEARKLLRETQKAAMAMVYKEFAKQAGLTPEQTEKLNDLLADHIMADVDHVTVSLRDKSSLDEVKTVLASEDGALQQQVEALIGSDAAAQYQDYSKNLLASISALQFKDKLTGTDAEKKQKSEQLQQLLKQQVQAALAQAGLPDDFQTIPMLNFANIASEQQAEQSLKLLDDIYQRTAAAAGSFLSPEEIQKLHEFGATAISNNRGALSMNRAFMAPVSN